ncbi:MAG: sugar ABC transporter permease [Gemmatimonadetes bacterium]|nr:MAG: sugar ABC transporter permease [Gemmatimonadota bacterium]
MAPRRRRCSESRRGRASRTGALGGAADAARGGRHRRLAAGHARPGRARPAGRAARRLEHRDRAPAAARNGGRLGVPRAVGAPPRRVLLRPAARGAVRLGVRTLLYALYVPVSMALALGLAVMIGGRRRSGAAMSVLRALFLLPYASSVVAVALVWQWMYHPDFGLINQLLTRARLGPVNWLGDPRTALGAVMLVSVWMQLGYQLTVFLAGLRAIPQPYLDAARVDGASAWQRFWRVTFPLLSPVTLFVLVTGIIGAFQVFALVMVLTGGGPLGATDVIVSRIYRIGWELLQFGDASALALLLVAVLFGATWAQLKLLDGRVEHA